MSVFEELKEIMGMSFPQLNIDSVTEESLLKNDLGLDSLGMMMIAIMIEEHFGIKFEGELNFKTVSDICRYIEEKI